MYRLGHYFTTIVITNYFHDAHGLLYCLFHGTHHRLYVVRGSLISKKNGMSPSSPVGDRQRELFRSLFKRLTPQKGFLTDTRFPDSLRPSVNSKVESFIYTSFPVPSPLSNWIVDGSIVYSGLRTCTNPTPGSI